MILAGASIREAVEAAHIDVTPTPDPVQYQPASLDVRLDTEVLFPETGAYVDCDERGNEAVLRLPPETRVLASTVETISLPEDVAAQLTGRSTVGRRGVIVHKTAGWLDPGFEGDVTLELYNLRNTPVELELGGRIAQLVFFQLDQPSSGYDGKYQGQDGPTEAVNDE